MEETQSAHGQTFIQQNDSTKFWRQLKRLLTTWFEIILVIVFVWQYCHLHNFLIDLFRL